MADLITTTKDIKLVMEFADGDDRTITLPNPRDDVTAKDINDIGDFAKENQIVIGDKEGAAFSRFKSAKIVTNKHTSLDLA